MITANNSTPGNPIIQQLNSTPRKRAPLPSGANDQARWYREQFYHQPVIQVLSNLTTFQQAIIEAQTQVLANVQRSGH